MAKNIAAIKRNNRKIHARKFLATPEGQEWLARKKQERMEQQQEEAEMRLVLDAQKFI